MKKGMILISFAALLLCVLLLFSFLFDTFEEALSLPASNAALPFDVIVIDAGHGGRDGGATGTNGALEKDLNLSVARTLADLFISFGYPVVETRTEDVMLGNGEKHHLKQADLTARLAVTKKYESCLFISIHMNTFPTPDCRGLQVWYSQGHADSAAWATAVQGGVRNMLQPWNNRKVKAATSSIYLLRHATCPAILVECGFLSSPEECERLSDPLYQKQLALAVFSSVITKINT